MADPQTRALQLPHLRWYVCGLLFFATTINYVDRQVLGLLKPVISQDLHWTETDYGFIIGAFQLAYALTMPFVGRAIDGLGTRLGYLIAVIVWSTAAMAHSLAGSAVQFGVARCALGVGEAANFPAAIKTVADWFPRQERALATGIFNSGSNIGAIVAPLTVPWIAFHYGWQAAFLATGGLGFVWVIAWLVFFRNPEQHPWLGKTELAFIRSDNEASGPADQFPYARILASRATWAFFLGKFLTDPVWWFYLYWLPGFLHAKYGLDLEHLGPPLVIVYVSADVGSIGGGWLSSALLKRGWKVAAARETAMLVCALSVLAAIFVPYAAGNLWLTVALVSIAASAHQGFSANLYTLASDNFPRGAVSSVVGFAGFGGAMGGALAAPALGKWLDLSHGAYGPLFVIAGSIYLVAVVIVHLLLPRGSGMKA